MKATSRRRIAPIVLLILISALAVTVWRWMQVSLLPSSIWTGLILFGLILGLALFNGRKKIPFLPLMKASIWLKVHVYAGAFAVILFLAHVDFRLPTGLLEWILTTIFMAVSISGVVGLLLERTLPPIMTQSGEALIHERIPFHRREIRTAVHELVLRAEKETGSSTIPDFYMQHVEAWLNREAPWWLALAGRDKATPHALYHEMEARNRYLSDKEHVLATELREWIETKENLDYQDACQKVLKGWLFLHIPLSFSLILFGAVHGVAALLHGSHG